MEEKRHLYIVISQTGTILSRALKVLTGAQYNHASISLSSDLEQMYSFGRRNPYNPFWGGFVKESPETGTFKRFYKTEAVILEVKATEEKYQELCNLISEMWLEKNSYHYNYLGVILGAFNVNRKADKKFYCSEFVKDILQKGEVEGVDDLPDIIQPIHFLQLSHRQIYEGRLNEYDYKLREVV